MNEGEILSTGKRASAYEDIVRYLLDNRAPINGIGLMGHFRHDTLTPPEDLLKILDRFAKFKLPLQITEFDMQFGEKGQHYDFTEDELRLQADYTRDFMTAMFSHSAVEGILLWGFWEGRHWYPGAALYRKDWSIKPNGQVWQDLVFNKWWTEAAGKTDKHGVYKTRGFLGDYDIEVRYRDKTKKSSFTLNKGGEHLNILLKGVYDESPLPPVGVEVIKDRGDSRKHRVH
jgi:endo-1,4-beta-xylanase